MRLATTTANGHDSFEIMRRVQTSKSMLWRWQQRYLGEGVAGLKRGKTWPPWVPPLPHEIGLKVMGKTMQASPPDAVH